MGLGAEADSNSTRQGAEDSMLIRSEYLNIKLHIFSLFLIVD